MLVSTMRPDPDFWRGKRVLLTGHTGFKGAWLALWLQRLGAQVTGVALPPATVARLSSACRFQSPPSSNSATVPTVPVASAEIASSPPRPE